jgi:DNA-binding transcriptional ArsR family regulator
MNRDERGNLDLLAAKSAIKESLQGATMRRNMDLARKILLALEECPFTGSWHDISIDGYSEQETSYHIRLLYEAGLVDAACIPLMSVGEIWKARTITWNGHEFLDASRDDTRWEKAKGFIKDKGAALTLEALKLVLSELVKKSLTA